MKAVIELLHSLDEYSSSIRANIYGSQIDRLKFVDRLSVVRNIHSRRHGLLCIAIFNSSCRYVVFIFVH